MTKIELELKEAPDDDDAILIESMPFELNVADEINTTYTNGELEISRQKAIPVYLFLVYSLYIHDMVYDFIIFFIISLLFQIK